MGWNGHLHQQINTDYINAMRNKDTVSLDVLRDFKTRNTNKEKELKRPTSESEALVIISQMVKQRKDSFEQFTKGGRLELALKEQNEIKILEYYLPKALTGKDLQRKIENLINVIPDQKDLNIGFVMKKFKSLMETEDFTADGKEASDLIKDRIARLNNFVERSINVR